MLNLGQVMSEVSGAYAGPAHGPHMQSLMAEARRDEDRFLKGLKKAITTGSASPNETTTGGAALRKEYLHGALQTESYTDKHAVGFALIPKETVYSTNIQWVTQREYGGVGHQFIAETGADGAFNGVASDANYNRQMETVKFLADVRQIGIVAEEVQNVESPTKNANKTAIRQLKKSGNMGLYHGDAGTDSLSYNGLRAQIVNGVSDNPEDKVTLIDLGGDTLSNDVLEEACRISNLLYANPTLFLMSVFAHADLMVSLFPRQRDSDPSEGKTGVNKKTFVNPYGDDIKLMTDPMLRPGRPLQPDGRGADARPRDAATQDLNSATINFATTPFTTAPTAQAAGTGRFWEYANKNTHNAAAALAAPRTPASSDGSGNGNRLAAGTYFYAAAPVYLGLEGKVWVAGATASGGIAGITTGTTVTAGQIVKVDVDLAAIGASFRRDWLKFRVYRCTGTPDAITSMAYVGEMGCPQTGTVARFYDNGFLIPGTDEAFLVTEGYDENAKGWFFAQLLPIMKRQLPNTLLSDLYGFLMFGTPILRVTRHHLYFRNIGRRTTGKVLV